MKLSKMTKMRTEMKKTKKTEVPAISETQRSMVFLEVSSGVAISLLSIFDCLRRIE